MSRCLNLSTRSYYDWRNGKNNKRKEKSEFICEKITDSFENSKRIYGSVRITEDLRNTGTSISRSTVVKYMRIIGLRSI